MNLDDANAYLELYWEHLRSGDDEMNAKQRIIDAGCDEETAEAIVEACKGAEP